MADYQTLQNDNDIQNNNNNNFPGQGYPIGGYPNQQPNQPVQGNPYNQNLGYNQPAYNNPYVQGQQPIQQGYVIGGVANMNMVQPVMPGYNNGVLYVITQPEGTQEDFWVGCFLGFFCNWLGLIIVFCCMQPTNKSKKGACIGFWINFAIFLIVFIIILISISNSNNYN